MKKRKLRIRVWAILAAVLLALSALITFIVVFIVLGGGALEAVLVSEGMIEVPAIEDTDSEISELDGDAFDEIHSDILKLDFSKVPDDAEFGITTADYMPHGWTLKGTLLTYALLCEICLRDEINPETAIQIYPSDLLGMWINESGLSGVTDTPLAYYTAVNAWGFCGPFQQNKNWIEHTGTNKNVGKQCIFISKQEDAKLDDSVRAIYGIPKDIKAGRGTYITADTVNVLQSKGSAAFYSSTSVNLSELPDSVRSNLYTGLTGRPSPGYIPDAAYTAAFMLRLRLMSRDSYTLSDLSEVNNAENLLSLSKYGDMETLRDASIAIAITSNAGRYDYLMCSSNEQALGIVSRTYVDTSLNTELPGVSMTPVKSLDAGVCKRLTSTPTNMDSLLLGTNPITGNQADILKSTDSILSKLSSSVWSGSFGAMWKQNVYNARLGYTGEKYNSMYYGFRAVNNGLTFKNTIEKMANYAVSKPEWLLKADVSSGVYNPETSIMTGAILNSLTCKNGGHVMYGDASLEPVSVVDLQNPNDWLEPTGRKGCPFKCSCSVHRGNHKGQDYPQARGTEVLAAANGVVIGMIRCSTDKELSYNGWGTLVLIKHKVTDGSYRYTLYGHLDSVKDTLAVGSQVIRGTVIGYIGTTGPSTGPHLHFEYITSLKLTKNSISRTARDPMELFT